MDFEEPIFEEMAKTPNDELEPETIQEWIDVSKEYHERGELVAGMHQGRCDSPDDSCCDQNCDGHQVITKVVNGGVSMVNCTGYRCSGPFL